MPPHEEINPECFKMFTEMNKLQAQQSEIITNHLEHDKEDRQALKKTLDEFNKRIKDLPTIKVYAKIASWVTVVVLGAIIVGYLSHNF